jgi:hypothetical protein
VPRGQPPAQQLRAGAGRLRSIMHNMLKLAQLFFNAASLDRSHRYPYARHTFAEHSALLARILMVIRIGL